MYSTGSSQLAKEGFDQEHDALIALLSEILTSVSGDIYLVFRGTMKDNGSQKRDVENIVDVDVVLHAGLNPFTRNPWMVVVGKRENCNEPNIMQAGDGYDLRRMLI